MAEAATAKGAEIAVELVVDSISTQLGYIWNYKTNFENLKRQHQKLEGTWAQVQHSVDEAKRNGEEIEPKVVSWLDSVEKISAETTKIIEDNQRANMRCFKSLCPDLKKRYQLSKNAANKADDVSELEKDGKLLGKVSYRTPPKEPWDQFLNDYKDFESRRSIVENVLKALSNSDVYMVGVYGMGGAGKTTLARVVGKQAEEDKVFDVVVFVEVSETPDVRNIQGAIAGKLGLELKAETETSVRANKLYEQLQKGRKNILLILDNIWKGGLEYLKRVGIPLGGDQRACKLLLTARGIDVLSTEMNCHTNFLVGDLNENDAWALFKKMAGACIEQHGLQSLAFDVANRCGGLPVAIVTVAKALKGKKEQAWRIALLELERPSSENFVGSVTAEAYSCIRLSYNQLNSDALKSIFLLCCTMEFTSNESVERLLRYGMGLDLFQTVRTMQEARDKVITLVQELKDSSLLLDTPNGEGFSIHDVVRDVGRAIAFKDHNKFTAIDGIIPQKWKDKNILKQCTSISLHEITELPDKELDCPLLQFLYMKGKNENSKIPDNFFLGMLNLRVLHLINMELSPHPPSLRCLVNLQTLCLNCSWLRDTGFIADIKDLEILVLSCNTIEQLPTEIGQLTQLRVLDMSKCNMLEIVPSSIISKLTQLEELYLDYGFDNWHVEGLDNESGNASLDELKHLSQLTTLRIRIRDHKMVPKGMFSQKLQRYNICIGMDRWDSTSEYGTSKTLKLKCDVDIVLEDGVITQLKGIEELCLDGRQGVKDALYELGGDGFPKLKHFVIRNNPDLVYVVGSSKKWELPCDAFPLLETLSLTNLIGLEKICHGQLTPNSFCRLRTVNVAECDNLKNMFSLSIAKHLSQLQDISVSNCENMEEIFTIGRRNDINSNEEIDRVVLDQLHSLSLCRLPKLRSFCSEEKVFASTSNQIILEDTPMPLFDGKVQLPNLKTLNLHEVNFEKIWHHQLPIMSPCFQNLTDLSVSWCHNLKHLFSSSTLGSFVQLQDLTIRECKVLEAIIRIDESGNNVEHPSLKKLRIEGCPETKAFIFNDKVSFPNLEEIQISNMKNLEMIWHNQLTKDSMNAQHCQKLSKVDINSCISLKKLFPPSIARNLFQLKDLYVIQCGIEEIVAKEGAEDAAAMTFVFPQLTCLKLQDVQELKCFYHGIHTIEWPVLKELNLIGCDKIDHSFALELFTFQKNIPEDQLDIPVFSNLEKLSLEGNKNSSRMIFQSQFPEILFPKLKHLEIKNLDDQPVDLPLGIFQRSHNLESLSLKGGSNKEIFWFEVVGKHTVTKKLSIYGFENLEQIWKQDSKVDVILQNLEELDVSWCTSLVTLIPPFACFQNLTILKVVGCTGLLQLVSSSTAKSWVGLKEMSIQFCCTMTKVVADDEGAIKEDEIINFSKLKSLELVYLSSLTSFCSWNYSFNFPSLETLSVRNCPKMKTFASGVVITPMLREIRLDNKVYYCEGDVNTSLFFSHERLSLSLGDIKMILQKFPEHQFSKLKSLSVSDDMHKNILEDQLDIPVFSNLEKLSLEGNSSRMIFQSQFPEILFPKLQHLEIKNLDDQLAYLPLEIFKRSRNLESLSLEDGSNKEIFWFDEVVGKHTVTKKLSISDFENLEQIWKQDSKVDAILQNLEELDVSRCHSLVTLMPPSACFQNLTILTVYDCQGLLRLVSSSTAKSLVGLKEMSIQSCNMMTKVVADDEGAVTEDEIINFSKLEILELIELPRLTSFCSWNYTFNFPSLETLSVENCPKMKTFASGVVITPMLREIWLDHKDYECEGDVNTSMQQIHEKLVFSSERLSLNPRDIKMILQKFTEHQISKLKRLEFFDDESTVFPFEMIQRFCSLEELKLIDCSYQEIFLCEEVEKQAETLAQLKSLDLYKLDHLEHVWKQDSKLDLILHTLETLRIAECNSLITLIPASASFQNLKRLVVWRCNGLISLLSSSTAKSLVRLEGMTIQYCNTMTKIVATEDVEEEKIIIFSKLRSLRLTDLSSLASFCSGSHTTLNFPSLESLYVIKCPKMKFFSSGVSSTPLLQQIRYDFNRSIWEGDLNTTIQQIHEESNPESSTKGCVSHIE